MLPPSTQPRDSGFLLRPGAITSRHGPLPWVERGMVYTPLQLEAQGHHLLAGHPLARASATLVRIGSFGLPPPSSGSSPGARTEYWPAGYVPTRTA